MTSGMVSIASLFVLTYALLFGVDAEPYQAGERYAHELFSQAGTSREDVIQAPGASYIAVHFASFHLPTGDAVHVRSKTGQVEHVYTGLGRADRGLSGGFHTAMIPGDEAIITYTANAAPSTRGINGDDYGFHIDSYVKGSRSALHESLCGGSDNSLPVMCYTNGSLATSHPLVTTRARAVARLLVDGMWFCTAWLAGSEGHLITNHHCISNANHSTNVDVHFMADSPSCNEECRDDESNPACQISDLVAQHATIVALDEQLDYTLLALPTNANVSQYGYLQLRGDGPQLQERIYIPHHPMGWPKRISSHTEGRVNARIQTIDGTTKCGGERQVGYTADTMSGTSGAPVIGTDDNTVIGLHHCGGCENTATDVRDLIEDFAKKDILISDLVVPATTPRPTRAPVPTPAPTTAAPALKPIAKGFCSKFHTKFTCRMWLFCSWTDESCTNKYFKSS